MELVTLTRRRKVEDENAPNEDGSARDCARRVAGLPEGRM